MEAPPGGTSLLAHSGESGFPDLIDLRLTLKEVGITPIENLLTRPAGSRGRRPYPRGPMLRAYLSMPVKGIADISALHRELMNNPALRAVCGFTTRIPSRPTLSRVFGQVREMPGLLDRCLANATEILSEYLPDLGREVAVDSTMVKTNSNRKCEPFSDPETSMGKQHSAQETKGWKWVLGYKTHIVADANHGVPLAVIGTTGSASDMNYLIPLVEKMEWRPDVVIADRGYDSRNHSEWLNERGIIPVIHKKRPPKGFHTRGQGRRQKYYSTSGTPLCECGHERPFIGTDPETGERVYGPARDCKREDRLRGFSRCDFEVRVNPDDDIRLFGGPIRRDGPEWKRIYRKRWSVERVFSRWKDRSVLDSHSFRGLARVRLLVQLYAIAYVAARIAEVKNNYPLPMAA